MDRAPRVSIVIPLRNQAGTLERAVHQLKRELQTQGMSYELILSEHGSADRTLAVARSLVHEGDNVRLLSIARPNYGEALKVAILAARGQLVICEDLATSNAEFRQRALSLLNAGSADLVLGSEQRAESASARGSIARLAARLYRWLLGILVGFRCTDTGGSKAFQRAALLPIVRRCLGDKEVFAIELVARAQRAGLKVQPIVTTPSARAARRPFPLKRLGTAASGLAKLVWYIRFPR